MLKQKENQEYSGNSSIYERNVLENIRYYMLGASGTIPSEWKKYEKLLNPEYQKYLELNKKFGSK